MGSGMAIGAGAARRRSGKVRRVRRRGVRRVVRMVCEMWVVVCVRGETR